MKEPQYQGDSRSPFLNPLDGDINHGEKKIEIKSMFGYWTQIQFSVFESNFLRVPLSLFFVWQLYSVFELKSNYCLNDTQIHILENSK